MIGTMVGVGIFGVPFAFAKAGFGIGLAWLIGIAAVMALFYLMTAELVLRTEGDHQLVGYAERWLGPWARRAVVFTSMLGIYGALLAYTIVISQFLHNVLSHFVTLDPQLYSILFTLALAPILLFRLRTVAFVEQVMTVLFITIVLVVLAAGVWHVEPANYGYVIKYYWFLPYGVLLFAFGAQTSIPIVRRLLRGDEKRIGPAIVTALGTTAVLYAIFAAIVVGISGVATSPDALAGLFDTLGVPIIILGSLFGILTISTSYLMLGTALLEIFHLDYRRRLFPAWLLTIVPPLLFYASGFRNFIDVIGTVGAVAVGAQAIIFILAYLRRDQLTERTPEIQLHLPTFVWYVLMVAFAAGILYALVW
jgi:amino acid permease